MSISYVQKNKKSVQTKRERFVSIIDSSSQSESLQRKADMANSNTIQCYGMSKSFVTNHGTQKDDEGKKALLQKRREVDKSIYKNSIVDEIALKKLKRYSDEGYNYGPISNVPCKSAEMNKDGDILINNEDFCKV